MTSAMIVAPGLSSDDFARQERKELIAPQDVALAVDDADTVAVAVEGNA